MGPYVVSMSLSPDVTDWHGMAFIYSYPSLPSPKGLQELGCDSSLITTPWLDSVFLLLSDEQALLKNPPPPQGLFLTRSPLPPANSHQVNSTATDTAKPQLSPRYSKPLHQGSKHSLAGDQTLSMK